MAFELLSAVVRPIWNDARRMRAELAQVADLRHVAALLLADVEAQAVGQLSPSQVVELGGVDDDTVEIKQARLHRIQHRVASFF